MCSLFQGVFFLLVISMLGACMTFVIEFSCGTTDKEKKALTAIKEQMILNDNYVSENANKDSLSYFSL